jgi:hypothetical protein
MPPVGAAKEKASASQSRLQIHGGSRQDRGLRPRIDRQHAGDARRSTTPPSFTLPLWLLGLGLTATPPCATASTPPPPARMLPRHTLLPSKLAERATATDIGSGAGQDQSIGGVPAEDRNRLLGHFGREPSNRDRQLKFCWCP